MSIVTATKAGFSVNAYRGDAKTLLAFNFDSKSRTKNLAGFTLQCQPKGQPAFFIHNDLRFEHAAAHAQDPKESANSSLNAPIHKFRWIHVPGSVHQGIKPFLGSYRYTVTPRFFDSGHALTPLDPALSVSVTIDVDGFEKGNLELGFTRGYTQSQAFVNHFGKTAVIRPKGGDLLFDTSQPSGANAQGETFRFSDEYDWLGFTAREKVFGLIDQVVADKALLVDVFAYDLNEPDLIARFLTLATQGRMRIILDDAPLHHDAKNLSKPEDQFEKLFVKAAGAKTLLLRGHFGRYAHDKVFVVSRKGANGNTPLRVLTGSTNFSVTGLYVNSNHVLIFNDPQVAGVYQDLFDQAWTGKAKRAPFLTSPLATQVFATTSPGTPKTRITFSPHDATVSSRVLDAVVARIQKEGKSAKSRSSVLFAVMQIDQGVSPVYTALKQLHQNEDVFSYGISDSPGGIVLYPVGKKTGVLVTGKPVNTQLPPPFNQVPNIGGVGHQVHHKFVVCGFNGDDPVVFCGSSNLALGGEQDNGDNLLTIHDGDVATAFAIEALLLVDHFNFLDSTAKGPLAKGKGKPAKPKASKTQAAVDAGWFLSTDDTWVAKFFDPGDLHNTDRKLFG